MTVLSRKTRLLATPEKRGFGNTSAPSGNTRSRAFSLHEARVRAFDREILETRVRLDWLIGQRDRLTAELIG